MVKDNPNHLPIRLVGKIESIKRYYPHMSCSRSLNSHLPIHPYFSSVRHSTEVVIMAPLTMENLLCHDIRLLFYNENKHILDIPSGESRPLYTYDASKNLAVRISGIPGTLASSSISCALSCFHSLLSSRPFFSSPLFPSPSFSL